MLVLRPFSDIKNLEIQDSSRNTARATEINQAYQRKTFPKQPRHDVIKL